MGGANPAPASLATLQAAAWNPATALSRQHSPFSGSPPVWWSFALATSPQTALNSGPPLAASAERLLTSARGCIICKAELLYKRKQLAREMAKIA